MTACPFIAEDLDALRAEDTPTVRNSVEIAATTRYAIGFVSEPLVVLRRKLSPTVGESGEIH
jgi:hypothetical protein